MLYINHGENSSPQTAIRHKGLRWVSCFFIRLEIDVIEEWVEQRAEMDEGLNAFIVLTQ